MLFIPFVIDVKSRASILTNKMQKPHTGSLSFSGHRFKGLNGDVELFLPKYDPDTAFKV